MFLSFDAASSACTLRRTLYLRSPDTTPSLLDDTGHAVTLESSAQVFRQRLLDWLTARGFQLIGPVRIRHDECIS